MSSILYWEIYEENPKEIPWDPFTKIKGINGIKYFGVWY